HAVSPALSLLYNPGSSVASRKVAMLVAEGAAVDDVQACRSALEAKEVVAETVAEHGGEISGVVVDRALATVGSVLYDAVVVLAAPAPVPEPTMTMRDFVLEAFRHGKPIGAFGLGTELILRLGLLAPDHLPEAGREGVAVDSGVVVSATLHPGSWFFDSFLAALAAGRHWDRGVPLPGG
ncbi:MAG: catalase HPII, partial [Candidatus Dormibacteraceae bacterium]